MRKNLGPLKGYYRNGSYYSVRTLTVRHCNDKGIYKTYMCITKRIADKLQERRGRERGKMRNEKRNEKRNRGD